MDSLLPDTIFLCLTKGILTKIWIVKEVSSTTKKCIQATHNIIKKIEASSLKVLKDNGSENLKGNTILYHTSFSLPLLVYLGKVSKCDFSISFQVSLGMAFFMGIRISGTLVAFAHPQDFAKSSNFAAEVMKLFKILY